MAVVVEVVAVVVYVAVAVVVVGIGGGLEGPAVVGVAAVSPACAAI
jgi:hypothetical protein